MRLDHSILDWLPHQPPFRFITTFKVMKPGVSGRGEWSIRGDEDFFKGHFPGQPIVPGVLLAESLAQLAGLTRFSDQPAAGTAVRLAHVNMKFDATVTPPALISLHASLIRTMATLSLFEVQATSGEITVASGTLTLSIGEKKDKESVAP
jgi:3-hydroxyacyl-[acyl-carrier-protein] dehydratase